MHFWIDKRSQCAYSGRHRVPSSLSSGLGAGRARYCGRKGMAAPVHRFAAVDCPPRRPHRPHRHHQSGASHSQRDSSGGSRRAGSVCVDVGGAGTGPGSGAGHGAGPTTIASLAAARSVTPDTLLRTAALGLHQSPMMAPHLKFGMLVSFALATVFLAGAKYYFDRQMSREGPGGGAHGAGGAAGGGPRRADGGAGAGVVCAAVACACGVGCALALCRRAPPPPRLEPDRVSSTAARHPPPHPHPQQSHSEPSDDISLATLLGPERPMAVVGARLVADEEAEAPPPYNIAVLMPAREVSPPAYSALS